MTCPDVNTFLDRCHDAAGGYVEAGTKRAGLEATRFAAEILAMTGEPPPANDLSFVHGARNGPAYGMRDDAPPTLGATYYALRLLQLAGHEPPDAAAITDWTRAAIVSGGEVAVDMDDLFYGVRSLLILDARFDPVSGDAIRAFLSACTSSEGGCALEPAALPDIERTYCAVVIQQWLGTDADQKSARARAPFVQSCYDGAGHMRMVPARDAWSLASAYWGCRAVELLDLPWPWDDVRAATKECARPDGGFGTQAGSTLWETYCALRVMDIADAHLEPAR